MPLSCEVVEKWWFLGSRFVGDGIPPPPTNRGRKNHLFGRLRNLMATFNGLYLRNETRYRQSVKCVDNYKVSPISCQNVMNFGPQTASNSTCIFTHYIYVNFAFHFIARLRRRRSANGTQPHFVKRSTVGRSNNVP